MNALRKAGRTRRDEYDDPRSESSSDELHCDEPSPDESSSDEDNVVVEDSMMLKNRRGDNTFEGFGENGGG